MLAVGCVGLLREDRRDNYHRELRPRNEGAKRIHRVILLVIGPVQPAAPCPRSGQRTGKPVAKRPPSRTGNTNGADAADRSPWLWCAATPLRRLAPVFPHPPPPPPPPQPPNPPPPTPHPPAFHAAKAFAKTGVRRLPVVTKKGILVGVIAVDDLIMLLGNEMGQMAGAFRPGCDEPHRELAPTTREPRRSGAKPFAPPAAARPELRV